MMEYAMAVRWPCGTISHERVPGVIRCRTLDGAEHELSYLAEKEEEAIDAWNSWVAFRERRNEKT